MLKKSFLLGLGTLLLGMVLWAGISPAITQAQQGTTGQENFIFVNYIGQEMTFDLDDTTYLIPGTDTAPQGGRLALQLPVGAHKYAANIPGGTGSAGETYVATTRRASASATTSRSTRRCSNRCRASSEWWKGLGIGD